MKRTYLRSSIVAGFDWHDTSRQTCQMQENGHYEISDPMDTIAKDILADLQELVSGLTLEQVKEAMSSPSKVTFEVTVEETIHLEDGTIETNPYEIEVSCIDSNTYRYRLIYYCGYTSYKDYYLDEIKEEEVAYLVTENILCPAKGVPLLERCYNPPFKSLIEATAYRDIMNGKKEAQEVNCAGELYEGEFKLYVVSEQKILESAWYEKNAQKYMTVQE